MSRPGDAGKRRRLALRARVGMLGRIRPNRSRHPSVREVSREARRWVSTFRTLGVRMFTAVRPWPG